MANKEFLLVKRDQIKLMKDLDLGQKSMFVSLFMIFKKLFIGGKITIGTLDLISLYIDVF